MSLVEGAPRLSREERLSRGAAVVTGLGGRLGRRLLRKLHRQRDVIGLGSRVAHGLPGDAVHHAVDPLRSAALRVFAAPDVGAIVHLGVVHNPRANRTESHSQNLLSFQRIIEYAERFEIPKVVLLSSGNAYGPRAENAQFLSERAPLLAGGRFNEMHALVELDMYAQSCFWRQPDIEVVILRPANILGTVRNAPSNYLRLGVVPTLLGFDPMMQMVHQDDVVRAILLALQPGVRGIFNVAGPPPVPLSKALHFLQRRTVSLPYSLVRSGVSGLFHLGLSKFPAPELDFIRYVCMVDDGLARAKLGYRHQHNLSETLAAVDLERWAS